jgi:CBS domain-containing protein
MKTARQLLANKATQGAVSIGPEATVYDALKLMAEKDIGALIVLDGQKLVGIFTERDYARKVALLGKSSKDIPMREIMTHRVLCVTPDQMIDECMAVMTEKRCRHLPVVEDKRVIGVLSIGDLVKELISEQRDTIAQLESYIMS